MIAFTTHLAEIIGPEARFVHQGMTSSDVLDTCLNVQLKRAADLLISDIDRVLAALKTRAFEHKMTPTIGRSHGIHAEPITFGLKLAYAYAEFSRARARCDPSVNLGAVTVMGAPLARTTLGITVQSLKRTPLTHAPALLRARPLQWNIAGRSSRSDSSMPEERSRSAGRLRPVLGGPADIVDSLVQGMKRSRQVPNAAGASLT